MDLSFPYQIVTFVGREPQPGEPVYYGANGWFAQVALKRRFKLEGINENQLVTLLRPLFLENITIQTGSLVKPKDMPVKVVDIKNQDEMQLLHQQLLARLNSSVVSRYPDREGNNYYAHITAEYAHELVIPVDMYTDREFPLSNVWLLKDIGNENSVAYIKIK